MRRIHSLNLYQKGILLLLAALILVFAVVYGVVSARIGYAYHDSILVPSEENGTTVYTGKISGESATFTVTANTVTFQLDDLFYGPYTVREDPTAIPADKEAHSLTGIEILDGNEVFFRGGISYSENDFHLFSQDNTSPFTIIVSSDPIDVRELWEPSAYTILELLDGPELTHKGVWTFFFFGIFLSVLTALSLLFADELFRFSMHFRIANADSAEPSDWELIGRYISWTILAGMVIFVYIVGLL